MEILESLQSSAFAAWVRESPSLLAYQLFITLHTIGLAILVGTSVGISFRILGVAADLPLAPMEKYFRFMWLGFWVNALSGVVLFITEPVKFIGIPAFYVKMFAIVVGMVLMGKIRRQVLLDRAVRAAESVPAGGKMLAGATIAAWSVAILAGRITAYSPYVQVQVIIAVCITAAVLAIIGTIAYRANMMTPDSERATSGARRSHA